ncbi:MAG: hypothetical protein LBK00_08220 [Treponema sp.]|nr:hypothetical protein [Treponema sp.]
MRDFSASKPHGRNTFRREQILLDNFNSGLEMEQVGKEYVQVHGIKQVRR